MKLISSAPANVVTGFVVFLLCFSANTSASSLRNTSEDRKTRSEYVLQNVYPLGICQGPCQSDRDCIEGLTCFLRSGSFAEVPGCDGGDQDPGADNFCIRTALPDGAKPKLVGNNGKPSEVYPLGLCEGDCDSDSECAGSLICYHRDPNEPIMGCPGGERLNHRTDYCVLRPTPAPTPMPSKPPSETPTHLPTPVPSKPPTKSPTPLPFKPPTKSPTPSPVGETPTQLPATLPSSPTTKNPTQILSFAGVLPLSSGPQPENSSLSLPSQANNDAFIPLPSVRGIYLEGGEDAISACPEGKGELESVDMNLDVGGKFIYLCVLREESEVAPITGLKLVDEKSGCDGIWESVETSANLNGDLNEDAGGSFIYLCFTKNRSRLPIDKIEVIGGRGIIDQEIYDEFEEFEKPELSGDLNGDLNQSSGGAFIFLKITPYIYYKPTDSWEQVGACNESGGITRTVAYGLTTVATTGTTLTNSLSSSLNYGFEAKGFSIGAEQTQSTISSLTTQLSKATSELETTTNTCDIYDDGSQFIAGCMWQYSLNFTSEMGMAAVQWNTETVRCTRTDDAPPCAPWFIVQDGNCTRVT